ncbi:hypothetical protein [Streptomyces violascens]|uniref:Oxidoreductase n=1 Tax=Streptomyces violascens TaxID=67381 RepID=A0ABQ3QRJ0_9ACTN|nr:hypothetical protein [Streptomyces violascens]GGU48563.1 hypothetical protein GCM10010289_81380 [Streptomyces violascens]GHI39886.1 hypothetical protein Sviol_42940 [Streptomyces violascens]
MAADGLEQSLLDAVRDGEMLDLAGDGPVDEAAMRSWGDAHTVSAALIRDLVRGRRDIEADPHGLRLRGARITGRVDLANITSDLRVQLVDCFVPDGLNLCDSQLPGLVLDGSCFGHSAGSYDPPVDAARFTAPTMTMRGAVANADTPSGAVRFLGAHLGLLDCDEARLANTSGPALHAEFLRVDHSVSLRDGFRATGVGAQGTVRSGSPTPISVGWHATGRGWRTPPVPPCTRTVCGWTEPCSCGPGSGQPARSSWSMPTSVCWIATGRGWRTCPDRPCTRTVCGSTGPCSCGPGSGQPAPDTPCSP